MLVKVWNDDINEYVENFKEQLIRIPAKGFIEMEEDQAILFRRSFSPIVMDGAGRHLKPKKIRIEYDPIELAKKNDQIVPETKTEKKIIKGESLDEQARRTINQIKR